LNTLYYGDNLDIMREYTADESVDLIYLDPPFNSKQAYNVIFRDKEGHYPPSQIEAFDGLRPDLPDTSETLKKAPRIKREKGKDQQLPL